MKVILYFDAAHAISVHDEIINKSGGFMGIRDLGQLESILEHIQYDLYYPTFEDKLTHLFYAVNKGHTFSDGNKRSCIALAAYFMEINGYDFLVSKFIIDMENIAVDVADNRIDKELLAEIISSLIYEYEFSEELKLKIIEAKTK
ncbi:MAG: type II toxin-antitoxin system death-on-curing family toxin [Ferruginibacter sp.]